MKKIARLVLGLTVAVVLSVPQTAKAYDLTCSDCISLCILGQCGFWSEPGCEAAAYGSCESQCTWQGYCP